MNSLTYGLPLGLRFYDAEDKQMRYKYECLKGVKHNEYQYSDSCGVPPFQIVRTPIPGDTFDMYLICVESETEYDMGTYCPDMENAIEVKTVGLYDYITYYGSSTHACCSLPFDIRTLVYVRLEDGVNTWYSELFFIDPSGVADGDTNYRLYMVGGIRDSGSLDLRVWK